MSGNLVRIAFTAGFANRYTGGVRDLEVPARNLRGVIRELDERFPGIAHALEEETNVAIDGQLYEVDFTQPVGPGSEVFFIPRIEGG